jgi:hypothetical protein
MAGMGPVSAPAVAEPGFLVVEVAAAEPNRFARSYGVHLTP